MKVYEIAAAATVTVDVSLPQVYVTIGSNSYSTYDATSGEWTEVSADASENFHAVQDDGYRSDLSAMFTDIESRTLNVDGETITLTSSYDQSNEVEVADLDAAVADTLNATVIAGGNPFIIFDFVDADDTVVLTPDTDFAGVTAIEVQDGTVDFTQVGSLDGIAMTLGSGAILTASQTIGLAIGLRDGAASYDLTVNIVAGDDIAGVAEKLNALSDSSNIAVEVPAGLLTQEQTALFSGVDVRTSVDLDTTNVFQLVTEDGVTTDGSTAFVGKYAIYEDVDPQGSVEPIIVTAENGKYLFDGEIAPSLSLTSGQTYDLSDSSLSTHP